jgi:hypothetical protein
MFKRPQEIITFSHFMNNSSETEIFSQEPLLLGTLCLKDSQDKELRINFRAMFF